MTEQEQLHNVIRTVEPPDDVAQSNGAPALSVARVANADEQPTDPFSPVVEKRPSTLSFKNHKFKKLVTSMAKTPSFPKPSLARIVSQDPALLAEQQRLALQQQRLAQQQEEQWREQFANYVYHKEIVKYKCLASENPKEQMKGAVELAEVAWNGGEIAQIYIAKSGTLKTIVNMCKSEAISNTTKIKLVQAMTIIGRNQTDIQEQLTHMLFVKVLHDLLDEQNEELRKWSAHCLFFLLSGCELAQEEALRLDTLRIRLEVTQADDWSAWTYNDAAELLKMLRFIPAE